MDEMKAALQRSITNDMQEVVERHLSAIETGVLCEKFKRLKELEEMVPRMESNNRISEAKYRSLQSKAVEMQEREKEVERKEARIAEREVHQTNMNVLLDKREADMRVKLAELRAEHAEENTMSLFNLVDRINGRRPLQAATSPGPDKD